MRAFAGNCRPNSYSRFSRFSASGVGVVWFAHGIQISVRFAFRSGVVAWRSIRTKKPLAKLERDIFIYGTGVRFLLLHAQTGQHFDDHAGFYFKLPRQLVDSDLLHRWYSFY
jgi:hypothetical protein